MDKFKLRTVAGDLEERFNTLLRKWLKHPRIENGAAIEMSWQFEQAHLILYIYGQDAEEGLRLQLVTPDACYKKEWREVSGHMIDDLMDTADLFANAAQAA